MYDGRGSGGGRSSGTAVVDRGTSNGQIDAIDQVGDRGTVKVTCGSEWFYAHRGMAGTVLNEYNPGDTVTIEWSKPNKFKNIDRIKKSGAQVPPPSAERGAGPVLLGPVSEANRSERDKAKDKSIEEAVIFKGAIELYNGAATTPEEAVTTAREIMRLVRAPIVPTEAIAE